MTHRFSSSPARRGDWCSGTSNTDVPSRISKSRAVALRHPWHSRPMARQSPLRSRNPMARARSRSGTSDLRLLRNQFAGKATALAFSENGELLAAGEEDGRIRVWTMSNGRMLAELPQGRNTIHCFSFTRNPRRDRDGKPGWLLAAGDSGGAIDVWDLTSKLPIAHCIGSAYNVYALAFSPDGMTLASAGRTNQTTILWDWAAARILLTCSSSLSLDSGLAFSRDGKRLATGHQFLQNSMFSKILVWELEFERGFKPSEA